MGYRSDVAVVIKAKDSDKLLKAAKDWDKKYNLNGYNTVEYLIRGTDKDVITKDQEYRLIVWNSIKWYANIGCDYAGQKFFESLGGYDIEYDFVRIGEEMGDYDSFGDLDSSIVYPDQCLWFNKDLLDFK